MKKKQLQIEYQEFDQIDVLPVQEQSLLLLAKAAVEKAYAPYSKFRVGAAVLLQNERVISGFNQENAAYPMCLCAERATIAAAASRYPTVGITHLAVSVRSHSHQIESPVFPCGACRQVISETEDRFQQPITLVLQGETGPIWRFSSGKAILPFSFNGSYI